MDAKPQQQHEWLKKFLGQWTYEGECPMGPDKPAETFSGIETFRAVGAFWVIGEGRGQMGGDDAVTQITLGFDPQKNRFVGTWLGSMMPKLWVYEGTLDEANNILPLDTEGPSMSGDGNTVPYRDQLQFLSDDHRTLTAHTRGDDGAWKAFMTTHYRRVK